MRKRNAIIFGTGFLLMVAAYMSWCWRPFYLRATITYEDNVPPAARKVVEQWVEENPFYSKPSPFTIANSLHRLSNPWLDMRKARVFYSSTWESVMIEELISQPGKTGDLLLQFKFKELDGGWHLNDLWP